MGLEMHQHKEYDTFHDLGKNMPGSKGHKMIRVHFIFDIKHDGRHKARLVAQGNLAEIPINSVYSGVISLRSLQLIIFIAELNGMPCWATDIGNTYLEAKTKEKVFIIGGQGFGNLEGHTLIIYKALYGLCSSDKAYREHFSDTLREMNFIPCKADGDVWMRKDPKQGVYEYIRVYVDDLCIVSHDAKDIINVLMMTYLYKLKGSGPIAYHLGCIFARDPDGTLRCGPIKYLTRVFVDMLPHILIYDCSFSIKAWTFSRRMHHMH